MSSRQRGRARNNRNNHNNQFLPAYQRLLNRAWNLLRRHNGWAGADPNADDLSSNDSDSSGPAVGNLNQIDENVEEIPPSVCNNYQTTTIMYHIITLLHTHHHLLQNLHQIVHLLHRYIKEAVILYLIFLTMIMITRQHDVTLHVKQIRHGVANRQNNPVLLHPLIYKMMRY